MKSSEDILVLDGQGVHYTCCTCHKAYSIKFVNGEPDLSRLNDSNPLMEVDIRDIENGEELVSKIMETAYGEKDFEYIPSKDDNQLGEDGKLPDGATSFVKHYSQMAAEGAKIYIYDNRKSKADEEWPSSSGMGRFELEIYEEDDDIDSKKKLILDIQAGSNEGEIITISIPNVTLESLKIQELLIDTWQNATESIDRIDMAIDRLSMTRSVLGAYQNRLEHTINNLDNTSENLQMAESRIRDDDIASSMVGFSKYSVLLQSSQLSIRKANEMAESILQFLK